MGKASGAKTPPLHVKFGKFTKQQIFEHETSETNLKGNLSDFAPTVYNPTKLKPLIDARIPNLSNREQDLDHTSPRFLVRFGTSKSFDESKTKGQLPIDSFQKKGFRHVLAKFYEELFVQGELPCIQGHLEDDKVIHIIVVGFQNRALRRARTRAAEIIAAVSFLVDEVSALVLWLGVSKSKYDDRFGVDENLQKPFQKTFDLGSFMLASVQQYCHVRYQHNLIGCQVHGERADGPLGFYESVFFRKLHSDDTYVQQQLEKRADHVMSDSNLVWMKSRGPIVSLKLERWRGAISEDVIPGIFQLAKHFFLDCLVPHFPDNDHDQISSSIQSLETYVAKNNPKNNQILIKDNQRASPDGDMYGRSETLAKIMAIEHGGTPIYLHDLGTGGNENQNCLFLCLSHALFQDSRFHYEVRCFCSYILYGLSILGNDHPLFKFDENQGAIYEFATTLLIETNFFVYKYTKPHERKQNNLQRMVEEIIDQKSYSADEIKMIFQLYSKYIMKQYTWGGNLELSFISTLYPVDFSVFECLSDNKKDGNGERFWRLSYKRDCIMPISYEKLSTLRDKRNQCLKIDLARTSDSHFTLLSTVDHKTSTSIVPKPSRIEPMFDISDAEEDYLRQLYQKWVNERNGKVFQSISGGMFDPLDAAMYSMGPLFTFEEIFENLFDQSLLIAIVRILDPDREYIECDIRPMLGVSFRDLVTYRAKTWVNEIAMHPFVEFLNVQTTNTDFYFISAETLMNFEENNSLYDECVKLAKQKKYITIQVLYEGAFFLVEANQDESKVLTKWVLRIADSGNHKFENVRNVCKEHSLVNFFHDVCPLLTTIKFKDSKETVEKQVAEYDCGIMTLRRMYYCARFNEQCTTKNWSTIIPSPHVFRVMVLEILLSNGSGISSYLIAPDVYRDDNGDDRVNDTRYDFDTESLSTGNNYSTVYLERNLTDIEKLKNISDTKANEKTTKIANKEKKNNSMENDLDDISKENENSNTSKKVLKDKAATQILGENTNIRTAQTENLDDPTTKPGELENPFPTTEPGQRGPCCAGKYCLTPTHILSKAHKCMICRGRVHGAYCGDYNKNDCDEFDCSKCVVDTYGEPYMKMIRHLQEPWEKRDMADRDARLHKDVAVRDESAIAQSEIQENAVKEKDNNTATIATDRNEESVIAQSKMQENASKKKKNNTALTTDKNEGSVIALKKKGKQKPAKKPRRGKRNSLKSRSVNEEPMKKLNDDDQSCGSNLSTDTEPEADVEDSLIKEIKATKAMLPRLQGYSKQPAGSGKRLIGGATLLYPDDPKQRAKELTKVQKKLKILTQLKVFTDGKKAPKENSKLYHKLSDNDDQAYAEARIRDMKQERKDEGKPDYTPAELEDWTKHYYRVSQQSRENAKIAVRKSISKDLKKAKEELLMCEDAMTQLLTKIHSYKNKEPPQKFVKRYADFEEDWVKRKRDIILLEQNLKNVPCFHPKDAIYALKIEQNDKVNQLHAKYPTKKEYSAVCRDEDGKLVEKPVPIEWLEQNFDLNFIQQLNQHHEENGWVFFNAQNDEEAYLVPPDTDLQELCKLATQPMYEYTIKTNDKKVRYVRAIAKFQKAKGRGPRFATSSIEWFLNVDAETGRYVTTKEAVMNDIFNDTEVNEMKTDMLQWFEFEFDRQNENAKRLTKLTATHERHVFPDQRDYIALNKKYPGFRRDDVTGKWVFQHYGVLDFDQFFYWDYTKKSFYSDICNVELAGLFYDQDENQYYGYYQHPKSKKSSRCKVDGEWVVQNFSTEFIERLKEGTGSQKTYLIVPTGSARSVNVDEDISRNPVVRYQQKGTNSCAFDSLASALYYLDFVQEAESLNEFKFYFKENRAKDEVHRIMPCITDFLNTSKDFVNFRKQYSWKLLQNHHNLLETKVRKGEFRWVVLWDSYGGINHAVAIVGDFIFDSNIDNAIEFNESNLSLCCGEANFCGIWSGYHFSLNQQINLSLTEDISMNPIVEYKKTSDYGLVFESLMNFLAYLGYRNEAERLNRYKLSFSDNLSYTKKTKMMETVVHCILQDDCFGEFRKHYVVRSMDLNSNILETKLIEGEFQWISLGLSHSKTDISVVVDNKWIFHPSFENALKLNQENLNICRGKQFYQIRKGYLFSSKQFHKIEMIPKRIYKPDSDPFFDSILLTLSYLGFLMESHHLDEYKMNFDLKSNEKRHFVMNSILHFIWIDDSFKSFRQLYKWQKLGVDLNLLDTKLNDGDFFWIHLSDKMGKPGSVITVVNDTIYCNSSTKSMELNLENLNLICDVGENHSIGIRRGYMFSKLLSCKRKREQFDDEDYTLL